MSSQTFSTFSEVGMIDARSQNGSITLPLTTDIPYRILTLKDIYGASAASSITLTTQGNDVFEDGSRSRILNGAFETTTLYAGQAGFWYTIGGSRLATAAIGTLSTGLIQNPLRLGTLSTQTSIQFPGLRSNYTGTVMAGQTTGLGTQELLLYQASSISDQIRLQTTGNIVFEAGASARSFPSTQTLATPTLYIAGTTSNVGIGTASPATTLDVVGQGRFQTVSTLSLNISTINGQTTSQLAAIPIQSTVIGLGSAGYVSSLTNVPLVSTHSLNAGSVYSSNVVVKNNGSLTTNVYGPGTDTLTIQSQSAGFSGGIASLYFGASESTYPLARIGALDQGISYGTSALVFQTATPNNASSLIADTFAYTGSNQTFIVPQGVTSINVYAWGAGGGGKTNNGGAGAMVQGALTVTPGETLTIVVGGGGSASTTTTISAYGGGGAAGIGDGGLSGGGGGRTAIQRGGTAATNDIVVAGGGGGASINGLGGSATFSGTANDGTSLGGTIQGRGGSQSAGGSGGSGQWGTGITGSRGQGGTVTNGTWSDGGGGGAGYYGGGGGGTNTGDVGGGGGGSSYTGNLSLIAGESFLGYNSSNGYSAPNTSSPYYSAGVAVGTASAGGNGLLVVTYNSPFRLTETMRINSNAYVGIGTADPQALLHVSGMTYSIGISTQALTISTINGQTTSQLAAIPIQSTVIGLGSAGYVSSLRNVPLVSTLVLNAGSMYTSSITMNGPLNMCNNAISNVNTQIYVRDGGFNVNSITNLMLWVDSADTTSFTLSGSNVTSVTDKSSNAYILSNSANFTYRPLAFNSIYSAFVSNGVGGALGINTAFTTSNSPYTILAVGNSTGNNDSYLYDSTDSSYRNAIFAADNSMYPVGLSGASGSMNANYLIVDVWNSSLNVQYLNGTQTGSNVAAQGNMVGITLGNRYALNGQYQGALCEILFFRGVLSTVNRQTLEGYLAWKWGIQSNLPLGHPYKSSAPSAGFVNPIGTITSDIYSNLTITPTYKVRLLSPTEWRYITSNVSGSSLDLSASSNYIATTYRFTGSSAMTITFPPLTTGAWWTFVNAHASAKTLTFAGTTTGLTSPYSLLQSASITIYSDSQSYYITTAGSPFTGSTNYISASIVQARELSTQNLYTNSAYIGNASTQSAILFSGIDGTFRGTAIAEQTRGTGTQELLLYKVSTITDQIRLQTTGNIVFEAGASLRSWPSTNALATPTLYIQGITSNIGIGTASPATTLDVVGTGRFLTLSTYTLNVSSVNGILPGEAFNGSTMSLSTATIYVSSIGTNSLKASSLSMYGTVNLNNNYLSNVFTAGFTSLYSGYNPNETAGGTYTTFNSGFTTYAIHTFRNTGTTTFNPSAAIFNAKVLVVGGGGGGSAWAVGGGGGAGAAILSSMTITTSGTPYTITVGAGGASVYGESTRGNNGSNSSAIGITAPGGGGGGYNGGVGGYNGGCGGGAGCGSSSNVVGIGSVGGNGGAAYNAPYSGGGGGGMGGNGSNATAAGAGAGGPGASYTLGGSTYTLAGGGGGSSDGNGGTATDGGGRGGSGNGSSSLYGGVSGTPNTGGGGGASTASAGVASGAGGSGIVIIAYEINQYGEAPFTVGRITADLTSNLSIQPTNTLSILGTTQVSTLLTASSFSTTYITAASISTGALQVSSINGDTPITLLNLTSTIVGTNSNISTMIDPTELTSTITGLGTSGFISTVGLTYVVASTAQGLGTFGYTSTNQLLSTTIGLYGAIGSNIATTVQPQFVSTVQGLGAAGYISSTQLTSTVRGLAFNGSTIHLSAAIIQASTISSFSITAGSLNTPSISTNALVFGTGTGTLLMPDIAPNTVYASTITASNIQVGWGSNQSPIQFYGYGTYSNSVIVEQSTGTTTQELLIFRGSNAGDRIRLQTTGHLSIETGVSSRLFPTTNSNAIPAMIIDVNSNVGIRLSTPMFTLDVGSTIRGVTLSTLHLQTSTIQGAIFTRSLYVNSTTFLLDEVSTSFLLGNYNSLLLRTAGTQRAILTQAGNLGIGTNNPQFVVDIAATTRISTLYTSTSILYSMISAPLLMASTVNTANAEITNVSSGQINTSTIYGRWNDAQYYVLQTI